MASEVSLTEEAVGKAVKIHIYKLCPLHERPCMRKNCEWFAEKFGVCAIQAITVKIISINRWMEIK